MRRAILILLFAATQSAVGSVQFDDSDPSEIRIHNPGIYEVTLRKSDGAFLRITQGSTAQVVSPGMTGGAFALRFDDGTWVGAGNFSGGNPQRTFTYSWDAAHNRLTGTYRTSGGDYPVNATIEWTFGTGPDIRSRLTLQNLAPQTLELTAHPVGLAFRRSEIESVLVPWLEGMELLPKYFDDGFSFGSSYPGQLFAQFMHAELRTGTLSIYAVRDATAPFRPASNLVLQDNNFAGGVAKFHHDYPTALTSGQSLTLPETVILVGSTRDEAQDAYWRDNGYDQLPTLAQKLAPQLLERLRGAVLIKKDLRQAGTRFTDFITEAATLPAHSLVHLVSFWPVNFDERYPDYLPPNAALGTQAEFAAMVAALRSGGHVAMPYTNPTWWDDEGQTLAQLGTDIAVRTKDGTPLFETYATIRGGYVVSPFRTDVIARQDQTRTEFTSTIPMDVLFEDQVGARGATYDGNPASPTPWSYNEGLLQLAARSAAALPIMTEGGWDRLARYETGYCNTVAIGWHGLPDDVYRIVPLAPRWAHRNLLFHSHNLAEATMTNDLPTLTRQVLMGYNLSIDLNTNPDQAWLQTLDAVQKELLAPLAGTGLSSFQYTPAGRMRSTFGNGVRASGNVGQSAWQLADHRIAADGFLLREGDWVLGGWLSQLYGQPLSGPDPHLLTFARTANRVRMLHPRGSSTPITLPRRSAWSTATGFTLNEVRPTGSVADGVTTSGTHLQFDLNRTANGETVMRHELIVHNPDTNEDDSVDAADAAQLLQRLLGPMQLPASDDVLFPVCDLDLDADVDLRDFAIQQRTP